MFNANEEENDFVSSNDMIVDTLITMNESNLSPAEEEEDLDEDKSMDKEKQPPCEILGCSNLSQSLKRCSEHLPLTSSADTNLNPASISHYPATSSSNSAKLMAEQSLNISKMQNEENVEQREKDLIRIVASCKNPQCEALHAIEYPQITQDLLKHFPCHMCSRQNLSITTSSVPSEKNSFVSIPDELILFYAFYGNLIPENEMSAFTRAAIELKPELRPDFVSSAANILAQAIQTDISYEICIPRRKEGLGMHVVKKGRDATIGGFILLNDGECPAKQTRIASVGDVLIAVNRVSVISLSFQEKISLLSRYQSVIYLGFRRSTPVILI